MENIERHYAAALQVEDPDIRDYELELAYEEKERYEWELGVSH